MMCIVDEAGSRIDLKGGADNHEDVGIADIIDGYVHTVQYRDLFQVQLAMRRMYAGKSGM